MVAIVKAEEKLAQLLANQHPDEWIYEQIGKCYQELEDYEKAIANLDLAYEALKAYFPCGEVHNPYMSRRNVCEKLLAEKQ